MNPQQAGQHQKSSNILSLNDLMADDMSDAQKAKIFEVNTFKAMLFV